MSKSTIQVKKKTAILCWTNLQLINCINYAINTDDDVDLFVQQGLGHNGNLIEKLRNTSIFSNVFVYDISKWPYSRLKVIIRTITDFIKRTPFHLFIKDNIRGKSDFSHLYFMTQNYIKTANMIVSGDYNSEIRIYNKVLAPWADELTFQLLISNKSAELIFYEDGIGSYTLDMYDKHFNNDILNLCKRLEIDINSLKPTRLILSGNFTPTYNKYIIDFFNPIYGNNELIHILNDVFDYKSNDIYIRNKYIYLTQPYAADTYEFNDVEHNKLERTENQILEELSKYTSNFIVRPHPRDHERFSSNNKYETDLEYNVWELICVNALTDDHILIGAMSTAQFTPKWWFDLEPWVIFTYGLLIGDLSIYNEKFIENAKRLKSSYRNPEKVFIVNTVDELKAAIDYIKG